MMNDSGKSDKLIVPKRVANKASVRAGAAERPEGRGLTKGNPSRNPDSGHSARQICHMRGNGYEREPNIPGRYSSIPEVGARCGSSARRDLCGGWPVRAIPTANHPRKRPMSTLFRTAGSTYRPRSPQNFGTYHCGKRFPVPGNANLPIGPRPIPQTCRQYRPV